MEICLRPPRPWSCREPFSEGKLLKLKVCPTYGHHQPLHLSPWRKEPTYYRIPFCILIRADYSRRRQRKSPTSKSKGPTHPASKGFYRGPMPLSQAKTSGQKKVQIVKEEEEDPDISNSSENVDSLEEMVQASCESNSYLGHNKRTHEIKENGSETLGTESVVMDGEKTRLVTNSKDVEDVEEIGGEIGSRGKQVDTKLDSEQIIGRGDKGGDEKPGMGGASEETNLRAQEMAHKRLLADLADENRLNGNKVFTYPKVAKSNQDIEVFLDRSMTSLGNESNLYIMGAFNDWRWKSFTKELSKMDFPGDWWSCRVHIPKEAYKMDFVFLNGRDIYENNNSKDFEVPVEGGMDTFAFEDFLLEERRRELEKLAAEQAAKERKAAEQRRLEEEKAANDEDKAQAKIEVEKRREKINHIKHKAVLSVDNLWSMEPFEFKGGDKGGISIVEILSTAGIEDGDWWYAYVIVPDGALLLDWVFADGPPGSAGVYDNNDFQDFHAIVPRATPEGLYWAEEEHRIYRELQQERKLREDAKRAKAERTAVMKTETKEKTRKIFLLSQRNIVCTEPLDVQAGRPVTVFYNPSNTVLSGKPEVWFKCSFNRWAHRLGPLPPQKMIAVDGGSHVKATVKVPLDAYMMDFVFCEREDGGAYDNKNGMDYHIPVVGGVMKEPPMHVVHVAVEMAPIAKVGGLGDVVTSLSRAVQDLGHAVDIILPKYDCLNLSKVKDFRFHSEYSWGGCQIKVWFGKVESLSVYFIEPQNGMFWAGCIYGCRTDGDRFAFFCHAALEFLVQSDFQPDIVHCHDWSSAPVSWLIKDNYKHYGLSNARVVFTIHNLEFGTNLISKAMAYADKATTVSFTYSKEVSMNPAIAPHLHKFHGILNGIDPDIWDPFNDPFIPMSYTSDNVVEGKRAAKDALQQLLGLKKSDHPLVGIITRLTVQKGIHLIKHAIWRTLERNGQVVLLGSAPDPRIQGEFSDLANQLHNIHGDRARLCLTYDEPLSHLIYAGADFTLVPSLFEPCGLTQLVAMRYGSIPVVRKTGGLYDTVFDVDHDKQRAQVQGLEPNGFNFDGADFAGVDYALNRAISIWYESRDWFYSLCKRVMEQDWSWNRPALDYMELYHAARKD
ncbi:starch synthase 3, chloroplastic/amyloplastic isoform X2 [Amborella trichopoda]|uniref:starch synthase 3, chloroplastic/amyloplastic isoform X2 n=1 Tax=Amborella trichopoda TaxID=13333 RepID=UPI0009BE57E4|nr:starch synthase 3, chloroplastic/amyloplastic isoform X2 [Amborella trichopoda]|eukprot:XP_020530099.1 starch synthase 3, chloroplastic/amyloplastic isoform X2 [Amborella trichopoda]